jgi:hypothetical protein
MPLGYEHKDTGLVIPLHGIYRVVIYEVARAIENGPSTVDLDTTIDMARVPKHDIGPSIDERAA